MDQGDNHHKDFFQKTRILNPLLDTATCYMTFTMFQSTLQEYCSKFDIEIVTVAHILLLTGLIILASLLFVGMVRQTDRHDFVNTFVMQFQICDSLKHPVALSILGNTTTVLALILLGVPLTKEVPKYYVSAILFVAGPFIGIGFSFVVVTTFSRVCNLTVSKKNDQSVSTYLVLSGMSWK